MNMKSPLQASFFTTIGQGLRPCIIKFAFIFLFKVMLSLSLFIFTATTGIILDSYSIRFDGGEDSNLATRHRPTDSGNKTLFAIGLCLLILMPLCLWGIKMGLKPADSFDTMNFKSDGSLLTEIPMPDPEQRNYLPESSPIYLHDRINCPDRWPHIESKIAGIDPSFKGGLRPNLLQAVRSWGEQPIMYIVPTGIETAEKITTWSTTMEDTCYLTSDILNKNMIHFLDYYSEILHDMEITRKVIIEVSEFRDLYVMISKSDMESLGNLLPVLDVLIAHMRDHIITYRAIRNQVLSFGYTDWYRAML